MMDDGALSGSEKKEAQKYYERLLNMGNAWEKWDI